MRRSKQDPVDEAVNVIRAYLRVCKHEFYHARNGGSEKKATNAEYR